MSGILLEPRVAQHHEHANSPRREVLGGRRRREEKRSVRAREESREPKFHHTYRALRGFIYVTHTVSCVWVCVCVW